jgi:predicted ATPase
LGLADEKGVAVELQIGRQLAARRCLIALDNFEHLIEAAADLSRLLAAASGITLLVTSRSVLRLRGEHVFSLAPLPVPEAERLFLARAGAAQLGFAPTEEEQQAIAEICRRLDGLPLAIELAAARTRVLDPVVLLARLDQRLNVLVEGPRDAPARQRTLRDTLLWSHELLSAEERRVFRALSVFVAGFFANTAEQVCATSLETLGSLCDQSLVSRSKDAQGRFYLLETIREFAFECLQQSDEREALEQRHLAYYVALAESSVARIHGSGQSQVLSELEVEHANLRSALQYATTNPQRAEVALSLASLLTWYWHLRGHWSEGRSWLEKALTAARLGPSILRGRALYGLGMLECAQEDFELAKGHLDESLQLLSADDGPRDRAHALGFRSVVGIYQRSIEGLEPLLDESLRLFEQCHDPWGVALTLLRSGIVAWAGGDAMRAVTLCTRSRDAFSSLGNDWGVAMSLSNLGESRLALGDAAGAVDAYLDSLPPLQRIRSHWYLALNASGLAGALAANGDAEGGARLLASARASMASGKSALPPLDRHIYENSLRAVREALDESTFAAAWEEGERSALSDAVEALRRSRS